MHDACHVICDDMIYTYWCKNQTQVFRESTKPNAENGKVENLNTFIHHVKLFVV